MGEHRENATPDHSRFGKEQLLINMVDLLDTSVWLKAVERTLSIAGAKREAE